MLTKILPLLVFTLILLGHLNQAWGQLDQYKSETSFDENSDGPDSGDIDTSSGPPPSVAPDDDFDSENSSSSSSVKNHLDGRSGTEDSFGRGGGTSDLGSLAKDKKYVNLNPETAFGPEVVTSFDFPDTSLVDLTKHMQKITGLNLIMEKDIKGKVSISAPSPITVGDAWKAYLTALNMNGYSIVKSGAFYKLVNSRDIRYTPTKIYTGSYTPDTENYVMRILSLKNIDVAEVARSFRPFMSRYGRIIEIKQTNTIIIQDTGDNITRLVRLIKFIDVPGHEETIQIIPVHNSSAQEIAKLLDTLLKGAGSGKFKAQNIGGAGKAGQEISKIIAEPRTNSIIAMANADGAKELRDLIQKLDVKVNQGAGQIHVYYLNHGDAETLGKTLSGLVSDTAQQKGGTRFTKIGGEGTSLFNAEVKITSDKDNNALVVTASPTDYLTIKSVIDKLDIPRDQVYVEGMIMETQVTKGKGFGISIIGAYGTGGTQKAGFAGGTGAQDLVSVLTNNITSLGGLFIGGGTGKKVTQSIGGQSVEINSISGLITAIANNANTNVLATPQILAMDNTDAVFEVAESVPVTEQTIANNQTQISVKQQKAGLTLKITPQINKVTRFIKLKIDQKIEEFRTSANTSSAGGIATTSRSAVTTVVVRDRDTIAMGGLMRDQVISSTSKVPLLGDIPLLGWLFKNSSETLSKVNLLLFMTPKIMDSYQKTVANTVKDVLNRRTGHIKDVVGEDDPYLGTVKALYDKANKQEAGPLYDPAASSIYRSTNESSTGIAPSKKQDEDSETIDVKEKEKEEKKSENQNKNLIDEDEGDDLLDEDAAKVVSPTTPLANLEEPDYKSIYQEVKVKKSGIAKPE
ncbi:MAG: type II secretion system secretin GspD [Bdellovibrio sp.]|nr:type II secretion system secretin GspD [Bdellovibrio sp.]